MNTNQFFQKYMIYFVLVMLVVYFGFASPVFLSEQNLFNILRQVTVFGIAAVGMTMVMLTGGIDLSVGSIIGVTGIVVAKAMVAGVDPLAAIGLALIAGMSMGLFNAFIINQFRVPPLIATLGMMISLRGLAYSITNGLPVYGFPESFTVWGQGYVWIIPVPVLILAVVFVIGWVVLNRLTIGRYIYGIGGNEEASRLCGINVRRIKYFVYGFSGALCGVAGTILLSRTNSGQPKAGTSYEMDIITAVVLGGVSIAGGQGKLAGVLAGVLIMGVLANGMIITNVGDYVQRMIQGMVLVVAVAIDSYSHYKKTKS